METRRLKTGEIVARVLATLRITQRAMAEAFGVSRRTCTRWIAGHSAPSSEQLVEMARLVHPVEPVLAWNIAVYLNESLESLGIVAPPATAPAAPPPRVVSQASLVDIAVCAAAEAMDVSPRAMRSPLRAAFTRARDLGLTIDEVIAALSPPPPPA